MWPLPSLVPLSTKVRYVWKTSWVCEWICANYTQEINYSLFDLTTRYAYCKRNLNKRWDFSLDFLFFFLKLICTKHLLAQNRKTVEREISNCEKERGTYKGLLERSEAKTEHISKIPWEGRREFPTIILFRGKLDEIRRLMFCGQAFFMSYKYPWKLVSNQMTLFDCRCLSLARR